MTNYQDEMDVILTNLVKLPDMPEMKFFDEDSIKEFREYTQGVQSKYDELNSDDKKGELLLKTWQKINESIQSSANKEAIQAFENENKDYETQLSNITKIISLNYNNAKTVIGGEMLNEIAKSFDYLIEDDSKLLKLIGKDNFADFSSKILNMQKNYNEAEFDKKDATLLNGLEDLSKWVQEKSKQVIAPLEKSVWGHIGDLISSSCKAVKSFITKDGKFAEHRENISKTIKLIKDPTLETKEVAKHNKQALYIKGETIDEKNAPITSAIFVAKSEVESWKDKVAISKKPSDSKNYTI